MILPDTLCSDAVALRSERLQVVVLPQEGGRIASIVDRQTGAEFLLQPDAAYHRKEPSGLWSAFETSACAGIVDCLPTVGSCGPEAPGGPVPDHGDFWRLAWTVKPIADDQAILLSATGYSRTLSFEKRLSLRGSTLEINNSIRNFGYIATPFLYAWHPLFAVDEGDCIVLPGEISLLQVQYSRRERLGKAGAVVAWPCPSGSGLKFDLSRVGSIEDSTADMLYTGRVESGWCALYRARIGQSVTVRFDPRQLPYLGLWLCYGGWPEDNARPRQYAVAFEPTVAPRGTLSAASEAGQAPTLGAGESFSFDLSLECSGPLALTCDKFAADVRNQPYTVPAATKGSPAPWPQPGKSDVMALISACMRKGH